MYHHRSRHDRNLGSRILPLAATLILMPCFGSRVLAESDPGSCQDAACTYGTDFTECPVTCGELTYVDMIANTIQPTDDDRVKEVEGFAGIQIEYFTFATILRIPQNSPGHLFAKTNAGGDRFFSLFWMGQGDAFNVVYSTVDTSSNFALFPLTEEFDKAVITNGEYHRILFTLNNSHFKLTIDDQISITQPTNGNVLDCGPPSSTCRLFLGHSIDPQGKFSQGIGDSSIAVARLYEGVALDSFPQDIAPTMSPTKVPSVSPTLKPDNPICQFTPCTITVMLFCRIKCANYTTPPTPSPTTPSPTVMPSSSFPTVVPTTSAPSTQPTKIPTRAPTFSPSTQPTSSQPTIAPSTITSTTTTFTITTATTTTGTTITTSTDTSTTTITTATATSTTLTSTTTTQSSTTSSITSRTSVTSTQPAPEPVSDELQWENPSPLWMGILIGAAVIIVALCALFICCCCYRRRLRTSSKDLNMDFALGNTDVFRSKTNRNLIDDAFNETISALMVKAETNNSDGDGNDNADDDDDDNVILETSLDSLTHAAPYTAVKLTSKKVVAMTDVDELIDSHVHVTLDLPTLNAQSGTIENLQYDM
eukprot:m.261060 g.261060  ORF g.261060 m.261060 type:complete len:592 (+) comp41184_c0_seq1:208-1983(+)